MLKFLQALGWAIFLRLVAKMSNGGLRVAVVAIAGCCLLGYAGGCKGREVGSPGFETLAKSDFWCLRGGNRHLIPQTASRL